MHSTELYNEVKRYLYNSLELMTKNYIITISCLFWSYLCRDFASTKIAFLPLHICKKTLALNLHFCRMTCNMKPQDLLEHYKTPSAIADALGCPVERFYEWRTRNEVPLFRQWQIQLLTKGRLKAKSMRDIPKQKKAA